MRSLRLDHSFPTVLFAFLLAVGALPGYAQTNRASITGTITDPSGAIVPGVEVTATNTGTAVATKTVSNGFMSAFRTGRATTTRWWLIWLRESVAG